MYRIEFEAPSTKNNLASPEITLYDSRKHVTQPIHKIWFTTNGFSIKNCSGSDTEFFQAQESTIISQ
jgi:hypothetical protein